MLSHLGLQVGTKNNGSVWLHALCVTPERISMPFYMTQFTDTFGVLLNVDKVVKVKYGNYNERLRWDAAVPYGTPKRQT